MKHCAENLTQTFFHHHYYYNYVSIILRQICLICVILCSELVNLMYLVKTHLLMKNQMIGHWCVDILKSVILMCKHLNNKKNNHWHFHRYFRGFIYTRNMWHRTSVTMSGKFKSENNFTEQKTKKKKNLD